jgi:hypothetical protein
VSGHDEILQMAKDAPPLQLFGRPPIGNGLNFGDILASMGVGDLQLDSSDEESKGH